ncbi:MAG: acyltransferase family protein [Solirubrobacterales bacterium]|nr:acyltransferase family protein [Solirubrobacterales bacterium]
MSDGPGPHRRQGLGGRTLDSDSPLFGGRDEVTGTGPAPPAAGESTPNDGNSALKAAAAVAESAIANGENPATGSRDLTALAELRELLPAAEPDRSLDDWGRSETVISLMEPLLNFYYRYWFRVETEGLENVPDSGGALLVSNHSGALPPDAPMIMQAIRNEHSNPRPLYMLGEHWFKGYPGVSMLVNKIGMVPAHRENAQRLLRDEGQLAVVFPEGQKGTRKMYWQRYRLRRFGRGGFVRTAIRARVPIVPIALIGAEEAMPIFAHFRLLQRLTGLIYFPLTPSFPHFGLAGPLMYLPAKFRIRFLEPIDMSEYPVETIDDPAEIQAISERIRGRIQHELDDMVEARESVWLG